MNTMSLELLLPSLMALSRQGMYEIALFFFCALFFLGLVALPIMILAGHLLAEAKKRTAYDKCAKQIAQCCCLLSWLVTSIGAFLLWGRVGSDLLAPLFAENTAVSSSFSSWQDFLLFLRHLLEPSTVLMQAQALIWLTLLAAAFMMTCAYGFWRSLKKARLVHQSLLIIVFFWNALALYGTLCILNNHMASEAGLPVATSLPLFFMPEFSSNIWTYFWNVAPYVPMLSFVFSGAFACIWLMMRRSRDDFGRDYYAQMLPWCAVWARNAWILLWFALSVVMGLHFTMLLREEDFLQNSDFVYGTVYLLLWSIPGILWAIGTRSKTPLRHKFTFILAFILSMAFLLPMSMDFVTG